MTPRRWHERLSEAGIPVISSKSAAGDAEVCIHIAATHWRQAAEALRQHGMRFAALWLTEEAKVLVARAAFAANEGGYLLLEAELEGNPPTIASLSTCFPAAIRMERHAADLYGARFVDAIDDRPWLRRAWWPSDVFPLRANAPAGSPFSPAPDAEDPYPFVRSESPGVHEVPVGPVHAGIIEPGHFRFLVVGEHVLHMEERFGYLHRGIERLMRGQSAPAALRMAARISGDASVAHAWTFARACEAAAGIEPPPRAHFLRAVLCERERMANHIGDIGAICNDAGFAFLHVQMQRLREEIARVHQALFGHRLLFDLITLGGVAIDLDADKAKQLAEHTARIAEEVARLRLIYEDHSSLQERVVGSGVVHAQEAKRLGLLGYAGRASGHHVDVRSLLAYPPYQTHRPKRICMEQGDVAARVHVRFEELNDAARLIGEMLADLPAGEVCTHWQAPKEKSSALAAVESWRGEILGWVRFGAEGRIERYFVRDPSAINWLGLELAVRDLVIADFPLNNKSFNATYAGVDL